MIKIPRLIILAKSNKYRLHLNLTFFWFSDFIFLQVVVAACLPPAPTQAVQPKCFSPTI